MLSRHHEEILKRLAQLPDSARVPLAVAAVHEGVSEKTIRRRYPLERVGDRKLTVLLGILRQRKPAAA
jgi:hypothetical protein